MQLVYRTHTHWVRTVKVSPKLAPRLISLLALVVPTVGLGWESPGQAGPVASHRVLLITVNPDDETQFNLGRFRERGWRMAVALVTNGEQGSVVQGIRWDYDPGSDEEILLERPPGPDTRLTWPLDGPRLREIVTPRQLARQRCREFLTGIAKHRVNRVLFCFPSTIPISWTTGRSSGFEVGIKACCISG